MTDHEITRETHAEGRYVYGLEHDGTLHHAEIRLNSTETVGPFVCSCGDRFDTEERAAAHLRETDALVTDGGVVLGEEYDYIPDSTLQAYRRMAESWCEDTDDDRTPSWYCSAFLSYMDEVRNADGSPGISGRDIRDARELLDRRGDELGTVPPLNALDTVRGRKDRPTVTVRLPEDTVEYIDTFGEEHGTTRSESITSIIELYRREFEAFAENSTDDHTERDDK